MTLKTRKPTGKAPWPMTLIAGMQKSGKSYTAAAFSASDLIDRTFFIEVGEGAADQYGALPGARYEIVEHDGSWAGILAAVEAAKAEPTNGKPNCIVLDSATELWGLLCDEQQAIATKRGKGAITMDQWNAAKKRWRAVVDALRAHKGPVILTARYEQVTVIVNGKPTTDKEWKIRAEKDIAYEVDAVIELKEPRNPVVTGVRTVAFNVPAKGIHPRNPESFNLDGFFRSLNIEGGDRVHVPRKEDPEAYQPSPDGVTAEEVAGLVDVPSGAAVAPEPPVDDEAADALWQDGGGR